jgi:hypothetical protein
MTELTGQNLLRMINRITDFLPRLRQYLKLICVVEQLIVDYLVYYPISSIIDSKDDEIFIPLLIKDSKLVKYHFEQQIKVYTFKFFLSRLLSKDSKVKLQVFEMLDARSLENIYIYIQKHHNNPYPCTPYSSGKWCGVTLLIPKNPVFDFLIKFLMCTKSNILTTLCVAHDYNPTNELNWGHSDGFNNFWHFKIWILQFFYDICCYLLQRTHHVFPKLHNDENEDCYPWDSNNKLDHSYFFDIKWEEENEPFNYFVGFYKRASESPSHDYNRRYNHYYIEIKNVLGKRKYYRGSMVGINPVSSIIYYLLSKKDAELTEEYPYIPPQVFRRILIQKIYLIHDWN